MGYQDLSWQHLAWIDLVCFKIEVLGMMLSVVAGVGSIPEFIKSVKLKYKWTFHNNVESGVGCDTIILVIYV